MPEKPAIQVDLNQTLGGSISNAKIVAAPNVSQQSEVGSINWLDELGAVLSKLYGLTACVAETKRDDIVTELLTARSYVEQAVETERSRSFSTKLTDAGGEPEQESRHGA